MFRGNIPGYYYDADKAKYFKIQPNHVVPINAKYSKTNVKREERETKKRKLDDTHQQRLAMQSVTPARALRHPLGGGIGLRREHGDRTRGFLHSQQDAAFVNNLVWENEIASLPDYPNKAPEPQWTELIDVQVQKEHGILSIAASRGPRSNCVYTFDSNFQSNNYPYSGDFDWHEDVDDAKLAHVFEETIVGLSCSRNILSAFTGSWDMRCGNVFIYNLHDDPDDRIDSTHLNVGGPASTLWDCKVDKDSTWLAFACSDGIQIFDPPQDSEARLVTDFPDIGFVEAYALDWLGSSTGVVGTKRNVAGGSRRRIARKSKDRYEVGHEIYLCDARSGGVASRLECRSRITGMHVPVEGGNKFIASSSRQISLFDVRMLRKDREDTSLLSFQHLSGNPRLTLPTQGDILAAVDYENKVQTYSLRTGQHLRTLTAPAEYGPLRRLRWEEDYRGVPFLQACARNELMTWAWEEAEREEPR